MMMTKTSPKKEEEAPPAFAAPPATKPASAVEDLERRLQMLGGASGAAEQMTTLPPPAQAPPAPVEAPADAAPSAAVKGGKNALLARIMAAKEKTQQAQTKTVEPPKQEPTDLLSEFDAPAKASDPPPAYETNFLPPPTEMPPPAFETTENQQMEFPPPPPINALAPPPPLENVVPPPSAPAASAPSFEDLLGNQQQQLPPPPPEDSLMGMQAVPPPPAMEAPPAIDEDILAALDPAERDEIMAEQRKIMEQIEKEKSNNDASTAAARAMSFDQRSGAAVAKVAGQFENRAPATRAKPSPSRVKNSGGGATVDLGAGEQVPLHGQEKTQQAIQDGSAMIVQCMNCQNWMQVTKDATLMFCPTCQVVSPVDSTGAATSSDMEAAAQMAADAQLAEKLQAEEYGGGEGASRKKPAAAKKQAKLEKGTQVEQSWYDWLVGTPTKPETPTHGSAEIRRAPALVAAQTGEEFGNSSSYDDAKARGGPSGGGGARVAESKSMFACVADAVGTATTSMYTLPQDQEGNVHGVDSSGLLAMSEFSRERES